MIHVVTAANRCLYERQLLQMHRQRAKVFVDGMGWNRPVSEDGGEYDEGDDDRCIYLLSLSPSGEVERSMRVRPADDWSVIGDVYPHFIGPDVPSVRNPDVWEMCRLYSMSGAREPEGFSRRGELGLALIEKAVQCGIRRVVGMSELFLVGPVMRSGWRMKVIGLPGNYGEGECVAVEVDACPESLEEMREKLNISGSVLLEIMPGEALAELEPHDAEMFLEAVRHLTPESRQLVTGITRTIAKIERSEGVDAAIAAVERVRQVISSPDTAKTRD
jgi:N-acyl-L-homoserine lactone synthetase